jgi:hypothetical protein
MTNLRRDGIHFLIGLTVTSTVLGAGVTIGGVLLLLLLIIAPGHSIDALQEKFGDTLQGGLFLAAVAEAIAWNVMLRVGFVPQRLGQRMLILMGLLALFMLMMVLFSL